MKLNNFDEGLGRDLRDVGYMADVNLWGIEAVESSRVFRGRDGSKYEVDGLGNVRRIGGPLSVFKTIGKGAKKMAQGGVKAPFQATRMVFKEGGKTLASGRKAAGQATGLTGAFKFLKVAGVVVAIGTAGLIGFYIWRKSRTPPPSG